MAILRDVPGLQVMVQVGGVDCVEYDDPGPEVTKDSSSPTSTKYVEAISDAEFSIHFVIDSDFVWGNENYSLLFDFCVDSKLFTSFAIPQDKYVDTSYSKRQTCTDSGTWALAAPKFSAVKMSK